jgi:hypothetical protein
MAGTPSFSHQMWPILHAIIKSFLFDRIDLNFPFSHYLEGNHLDIPYSIPNENIHKRVQRKFFQFYIYCIRTFRFLEILSMANWEIIKSPKGWNMINWSENFRGFIGNTNSTFLKEIPGAPGLRWVIRRVTACWFCRRRHYSYLV